MPNPTPEDNAGEYMLDISWRCLTAPSASVLPRFTIVAPTRSDLSSLFRFLRLTFCRGLLDVVKASEPPPVEWFETLPNCLLLDQIPNRSWGVYVIILKKDGQRPRLYNGII